MLHETSGPSFIGGPSNADWPFDGDDRSCHKERDSLAFLEGLAGKHPGLEAIAGGSLYREMHLAALDPVLAKARVIEKLGFIIDNNAWLLEKRFRSTLMVIMEASIWGLWPRLRKISELLDHFPRDGSGDPVSLRQLVGIIGRDGCTGLPDCGNHEMIGNRTGNVREFLSKCTACRNNGSSAVVIGDNFRERYGACGKLKITGHFLDGLAVRHPWMYNIHCLSVTFLILKAAKEASRSGYDPEAASERLASVIESNFDVFDERDVASVEHVAAIVFLHSGQYDYGRKRISGPKEILSLIETFFGASGVGSAMKKNGMLDDVLCAVEAALRKFYREEKLVGQLFKIPGMIRRYVSPQADCETFRLVKMTAGIARAACIVPGFSALDACQAFLEMADAVFRSGIQGDRRRRVCEAAARHAVRLLRSRVFPAGLFRAVTRLAQDLPVKSGNVPVRIEEFLSEAFSFGLAVRDIELGRYRDKEVQAGTEFRSMGLFLDEYAALLFEKNSGILDGNIRDYLEIYVKCLERAFELDEEMGEETFTCTLLCRLLIASPGYALPENRRAFEENALRLTGLTAAPGMRLAGNEDAYRSFPYREGPDGGMGAGKVSEKYGCDISFLGSLASADPSLIAPVDPERLGRLMEICLSSQAEAEREAGNYCSLIPVKGLHSLLMANPGILAGDAEKNLASYIALFMKYAKMTVERGLGFWTIKRFDLLAGLLEKRPETADPVNIGNLREIVGAHMAFIRHRYDPIHLYRRILDQLFEREPGLLLAENIERLKAALNRALAYLDRGILPPDLEEDEGRLFDLQNRRDEIACGGTPDLSSDQEIDLFYSAIFGHEWEPDCLEDFHKSVKEFAQYGMESVPLGTGRVLITADGFRPAERDASAKEMAVMFRDYLLSLHGNSTVLADEPALFAQLSAGEKGFIIRNLCGPSSRLRGMVLSLAFRQLENFQPSTASLIEKILFVISMRESPELLRRIAGQNERESLLAVRDLLRARARETLNGILSTEYNLKLAGKITSATGGSILSDDFVDSSLGDKVRLLGRECGVYGHILGLVKRLNAAAAAGPENAALPIPMEVNTNSFGETLLLEKDFRLNMEEIHLTAAGGRRDTFILEVKNFNYPFFGSSFRRRRLRLKNGLFEADDCILGMDDPVAGSLGAIQRLSPQVEARLRRNYHIIKDGILPLLRPVTEKTMAMVDSIERALGCSVYSGGKGGFVFIPGKDSSLFFKHVAAHDCSVKMKRHVAHPSSVFFKIINGGRWRGYAMLLELKCRSGGKALAIDVINIETRESTDWAALVGNFVDCLVPAARRMGYRYILISSDGKRISNSEYISGPVNRSLASLRVIPPGEFSLEPPDRSFQSLAKGFRVLWEASESGLPRAVVQRVKNDKIVLINKSQDI